jgi:hypothetical protein
VESSRSKQSANNISDLIATTPEKSPGMVEVTVHEYLEVDAILDNAVAVVQEAAIRHQTGIMITRTGPGQYIVRGHSEVPFGLIRQQHR